MHSDHAEDQKKLATLLEALKMVWDCELRGEDAMLSMDMVALFPLIAKAMSATVEAAGGLEVWNSLLEDKQSR